MANRGYDVVVDVDAEVGSKDSPSTFKLLQWTSKPPQAN